MAAATINARFDLVQAATSTRTVDPNHLRSLWEGLRESCKDGGSDDIGVWLAILSSNVVNGILDLLKKIIDLDTNGVSSAHAINFTAECNLNASKVITRLNSAQKTATRSFLKSIATMAPSTISKWWKKFRHFKAQWIQEGSLMENISGFLGIFRIATSHGNTAMESLEYPSQSMTTHPDLHDYLLFVGVFIPSTDMTRSYILCAIKWSTESPIEQSQLETLPSLKEQLEIHPLALSLRLAEILQTGDDSERFDVIVTTTINLMPSFSQFLKQGDLAHTIGVSYWTLCAATPRRPEKDRTTYNTLVIISQLTEDHVRASNPSNQTEVARLLSSDCDLLCLVEKVTILHTTSLTSESFDKWKPISRLLTYNPTALRPPLRRDLLRMLDYLRTVQKTHPRLFDFWVQLGTAAKISESELREEHNRERKAARVGIVGCSWYKCAMYEQESARNTFMCAGCHKAAYCGPNCQDRDWSEGGHKSKCKK
ncbi:hypothetical protein FRB95_002978 [Tulasnella sp. JGI-2019a]|nr:hypothetical protein FRB95_002978 [Tulasnella sp. JGI-2019a]